MSTESIAIARSSVSLRGLSWAALGVLAFSFTFPATALALRGFDPYLVGAGRSVIAAVIAGGCLAAVRAQPPRRDQWPGLIAVAIGCGIGFGLLSALALHRTTSSHGAIVIGLLPAATAVVAVVRAGERPHWSFWAATMAGGATIGAYSLVRASGTIEAADLLLIAALAVAAVGYAEGGRLARGMPGWQVIAWGVLLALPVSLPVTAWSLTRAPLHASPEALLGVAYVGLVSMFFGFFAWYRGLAEAGIARASQLQLAQPLLTIAWSIPLLGDRAGPGALLVAAVVIGCVLVTQRSRGTPDAARRPDAAPPAHGLGATQRTRVRRHSDRARTQRRELHDLLDDGLVAHVGFVADGHPVVLPMAYARDGERLLLHGSSRNRMLRALAAGGEVSATITLIDGLVLAHTAFTHSMNYRSAVINGRAREVVEPEAKVRALDHFVDSLLPGRSSELPPHTRKELAATLVIALPLTEASVKARAGGPKPVPDRDGASPWTGVIPIQLTRGAPRPTIPLTMRAHRPS